MPWLFLEPPAHLLEKIDASFDSADLWASSTLACVGKEPGVAHACGASLVSAFPLPSAVLPPSRHLALQFSPRSSGTHCPFFLCTSERIKGEPAVGHNHTRDLITQQGLLGSPASSAVSIFRAPSSLILCQFSLWKQE